MKRGAITKAKSQLVAVWIPNGMVEALDVAVKQEDTDKSKIIRRALRRQFADMGIKTETEVAA